MRQFLRIRGGSGLGDSLYLQAIVRHLLIDGEAVEACTNWPDVFRPLVEQFPRRLRLAPFRKDRIDRVAHYIGRKAAPGSNQFEDCCRRAGVAGDVELCLEWEVADLELVSRVLALPGPVIAVQMPRMPFGREDGEGAELLPDFDVVQGAINRLRMHGASIVQIGKGDALCHFEGIDLDLANQTTVAQLLDIAASVDGFLGYVSFMVPLAESLGRPALAIWSRRGVASDNPFIRTITPAKVLHRATSRAVFDDAGDDEIRDAADALYLAC